MRHAPSPFGALALLLIAACAMAQDDCKRTGKTFAVTLHPGKLGDELTARLADEALAAVEAMRPVLDKWQLVPPKPPVLHLHRDATTFRQVEKGNTGFPFTVDDFCVADGSEAHVLLPPLSMEILQLLGLPPAVAQALQLCAGKAAAQQASEVARRDRWFADVVGYAVLDATTNPKGQFGVDPQFDLRREAFWNHRVAGYAMDLDMLLVDDERLAARKDLLIRRERATLTAQLCSGTGSGWVRKFLGKQGKPEGLSRQGLVENVLGKDKPKNETRFNAMIKSLGPFWCAADWAAARDGRIVLAGTKETSSGITAASRPPAGPYVIRARVEIAGGSQKECRFTLDCLEDTMIGVITVPGKCEVHLWTPAKKWQKLKGENAPVVVGKPFDLVIEVDTEIRAAIDGTRALACPHQGRGMHGEWHVATNDSLVFLENVRCEPLVPPKKK